ncbi:AAA family ATPase [Paratractidigestivibacter sp.]|uniref:AAA family ATPase n=1 Tax=Paratractidigestivibacter sp. TaxID=2847316 RepID=UPI003AB5453F
MSRQNPFTPMFGGKPQHFFGRAIELNIVKHAIADGNSPYRVIFVTGNRGCGKTALLEQFSITARDAGWTTVDVHSAHASEDIVRRLAGADQRTVERVAAPEAFGLSAGHVGISESSRFDGRALTDVLIASSEKRKRSGVFITIDEVQKIPEADMENVCAAVQMALRKGFPVMLVLAGLCGAKEKISSYKGCTFMQRAYDIRLGSLGVDEARSAFEEMLGLTGFVTCGADELDYLCERSYGYPYLIQLLGYYLVEVAAALKPRGKAEVTRDLIDGAEAQARVDFRTNVIEPSVGGYGPGLTAYLEAIVDGVGVDGRSSTGDAARAVGKSAQQCAPYRARLIERGTIVPAGYGYVRLNIPHLRDYFAEEDTGGLSEDGARIWNY